MEFRSKYRKALDLASHGWAFVTLIMEALPFLREEARCGFLWRQAYVGPAFADAEHDPVTRSSSSWCPTINANSVRFHADSYDSASQARRLRLVSAAPHCNRIQSLPPGPDTASGNPHQSQSIRYLRHARDRPRAEADLAMARPASRVAGFGEQRSAP